MRILLLLIALCGGLAFGAQAQQLQRVTTCGTGSPPSGASPGTQDTTGQECVSASLNVSGASGTPTESAVTCGTGTTLLLAANAASKFILIKVPLAAANPVWVSFNGAAVAAPPSIDLAQGSAINWSPVEGYLPTAQINCIATAATAVTVVYK